jgi:hypothetical protein
MRVNGLPPYHVVSPFRAPPPQSLISLIIPHALSLSLVTIDELSARTILGRPERRSRGAEVKTLLREGRRGGSGNRRSIGVEEEDGGAA